MGIAMLLLLALIVYSVIYVNTHTNTSAEPAYAANLPAQGKYAAITTVSTHWVKKGDKFLPAATISSLPVDKAVACILDIGAQMIDSAPKHKMSGLQDLENGRSLNS